MTYSEDYFATYFGRGFLPKDDPLTAMPSDWGFLDNFGRELPDIMADLEFRARILPIPSVDAMAKLTEKEKNRAMMIYGFGASAYVHSTEPSRKILCRNLAVPLVWLSAYFGKPPILSYCSYALNNWRRIDLSRDVELDNIELLQHFVRAYDEDWFILIHVDIEKKAAVAIDNALAATHFAKIEKQHFLSQSLSGICSAFDLMIDTLKRMPERCSPEVYYHSVRPWIMSFQNVIYEGVNNEPRNYRGETGAQSSIIPFLVAVLGGKHKKSILTEHIRVLHGYMLPKHKALIDEAERNSKVREFIIKNRSRDLKDVYNKCLEKMYEFRRIHYEYAAQYIHQKTQNPTGTGGTMFMEWLKQMRDETEEWYLT